jgi:hypothetical protein
MPQVFPKSSNAIARILVIGLPMAFAGSGVGLAAFYRSDYTTGRNEVTEQPVPFSHKHHVSELGIDCRYCHTGVEHSAVAGIPPTKTCMNCHQQMWAGAELLEPVRNSYKTNVPIEWTKVHNTPHYVYFNHSIHVAKGVGCVSCHDRIDNMPLVKQSKTLLMEWCLDCHRHPENHLRPKSEIYNLGWKPGDVKFAKGEHGHEMNYSTVDVDGEEIATTKSQAELGRQLKEKYHVRDSKTITNCSICHR